MSVSRSYAKALFQVAQERKLGAQEMDAIESELSVFAQVISGSRELFLTLGNPTIPTKEKGRLSEAISARLGLSKLTTQFISLVAGKNRVALFSELAHEFRTTRLTAEGSVLGKIVSAEPLAQSDLDDLAASFTRKLGQKVFFSASVDAELLAGLQVTVQGVTYDGSLRSQLQQLKEKLVYHSSSTINHS